MNQIIKAVQFGCGPIGCSIARLAASKASIDIVGAIDLTHAGQKLSDVAGIASTDDIIISDDAQATLAATQPDIVLHATGSSFGGIFSQLELALSAGANIVSTCEELSYPFFHQPELSKQLDTIARQAEKTVMATGVNPGFLMDAWPSFMTGICQQVNAVRSVRLQNAAHRRLPFQKKIGAGLTVDEFKQRVDDGIIRHVGLPESAAMIAAALNWDLDSIDETIEPIITAQAVQSDELQVAAGQAAGVKQISRGIKNGSTLITLDFQAYIGAEHTYDAVYISGSPDLEIVIKDGVHGDLATASTIVNAIPSVVAALPGLRTMLDIALVSATS